MPRGTRSDPLAIATAALWDPAISYNASVCETLQILILVRWPPLRLPHSRRFVTPEKANLKLTVDIPVQVYQGLCVENLFLPGNEVYIKF